MNVEQINFISGLMIATAAALVLGLIGAYEIHQIKDRTTALEKAQTQERCK